jgi:uncharacterized protein
MWLWIAALLLLPSPAEAQSFPALSGRVVDAAGLLDPAQERALDAKLAALEKESGRQMVVATVPDLEGRDIADYGYRLGRAWGIGAKDNNDGALLIVAPNDRRVRIEVGYGLEGIMTDAISSIIISRAITPRFKQGDFAGGITAGVAEIAALLKLTPEEAKVRIAAMEAQSRRDQRDDGTIGAIGMILFIGVFVLLPMLARRGGGRRYRGAAGLPVILWGPGLGGGGGWGGSNSDSGSSGGFSGGGGSFGGGGASGSW